MSGRSKQKETPETSLKVWGANLKELVTWSSSQKLGGSGLLVKREVRDLRGLRWPDWLGDIWRSSKLTRGAYHGRY